MVLNLRGGHNTESDGVTDEPVRLHTTDVRQRLLLHLVDEAEHQLHHQVLGNGFFLKDEKEGDVVYSLRAVAVGVVQDSPGVPCDTEGAGLDILAVGDGKLGAQVALDPEHVESARGAGDDGGGEPVVAGDGHRGRDGRSHSRGRGADEEAMRT